MRVCAAILACFALATLPNVARAQRPTSQRSEYSPYEREAIDIALAELGRKVDDKPEGKRIGKIESVRLDVLERRDPGPELLRGVPIVGPLTKVVDKPLLNKLHVLSKEWIIRRALLLKEGDEYIQVMIDETARNMRAQMPLQVSLVVIIPLVADDPSVVDLLMITKDIWSLRLSFDTAVTTGGLENLLFVPQETNFLGLHHTAQTRFQLRPASYSFGVGYKIPRFGHSWVGASANAGIIMNRATNSPEGASVGVGVGQVLYSSRAPWAWDADVGYSNAVERRYSNAQVLGYDSRLTPERDRIPSEYKARSFSGSASVTRSFGWAIKSNFTLSMNASASEYATFDLSRFNPVAVEDFKRRFLPVGENRVYPALGASFFTNDYLRTLDINTLVLQEDVRLGPSFSTTLYPVSKALGSSRDLVGLSASWSYTRGFKDGFARASFSVSAENAAIGGITDGSVGGGISVVTPRFKVGRLVMNASFNNRYANYLNSRVFIGGEDRLRGYPTAFFFGKDTVFYNIEYRSRSIEVLKAAIGGVLFYDAGDATNGFDKLRPKQSVGAGVRVLLPQINRAVFRLDFAVPIERGPFPETGSPGLINPWGMFFAFDQAFSP